MLTISKAILTGLQVILSLSNLFKSKLQFDAGAKSALAKTLVGIAKAGGVAGELRLEVEAMTDEELDEELLK